MPDGMDLRELRKEVQALPSADSALQQLRQQWLIPLSPKNPLLDSLNGEHKRELRQKVASVHKIMAEVREDAVIRERLARHAKYLVELKLTAFNGDAQKSMLLINHLLYDEEGSIHNLVAAVKRHDAALRSLQEAYNDITNFLNRHLNLEGRTAYHAYQHKRSVEQLATLARQQQKLAHALGSSFVALAREVKQL